MLLEDSYIAYVNLDHRQDRKDHMEAELARVGIKAERIRGTHTKDRLWNQWPYERMYARTPGAIGCWLGQEDILWRARAAGKHAMVMEDDLIFCSDFMERMSEIDAFAETHPFDIIWLGGTVHVGPPYWHTGTNPELPYSRLGRDAECTDNPRMLKTYGCFCTYCYIVNKDSIMKVLERLKREKPTSIGIDFSMIRMQPDLNTFCYVPGLVKQKDNLSDIGTGVTYFSGFSRLGPYWWADKKDEFDPITFNWRECKI